MGEGPDPRGPLPPKGRIVTQTTNARVARTRCERVRLRKTYGIRMCPVRAIDASLRVNEAGGVVFAFIANAVTPAVRLPHGQRRARGSLIATAVTDAVRCVWLASTLCVRQTLWEQGTSIALSERSDGAVGLLAAMVSDSDSVQSWHSVYQ
jgi:hypothetical protein